MCHNTLALTDKLNETVEKRGAWSSVTGRHSLLRNLGDDVTHSRLACHASRPRPVRSGAPAKSGRSPK